MKEGCEDHAKFRMLARLLKIPLPYANGIMERLWNKAAKFRADGAVGRWSNLEIAEYCAMPIEVDPDAVVEAMISSRLLDVVSDANRLIIHDWPDHCTHFTHNKLARQKQYFANGQAPNMRRLDSRYRAEAEAFYGITKMSAQSGEMSAQSGEMSAQSGEMSAQSKKSRKQTDVVLSAQSGTLSAQSAIPRARPTPTPKPKPKPKPHESVITLPIVVNGQTVSTQQQHSCPLDSVVVADALRAFGSISKPSVRKFIAACLNGSGRYTESEIAAEVRRMGSTFTDRVENPIGVLLAGVPGTLLESLKANRRTEVILNWDRKQTEALTAEEKRWMAEEIMQQRNRYAQIDIAWAREVLQS
jgi:hypothetical protein